MEDDLPTENSLYLDFPTYDVDGELYKTDHYFGADFDYKKLNIYGGFNIYTGQQGFDNMQYLFQHNHSLEVYNFRLNDWIKVEVMPTDRVLKTKGSLNYAHLSSVNLVFDTSTSITEVMFGAGAEYHMDDFINDRDGEWGKAFHLRFKFSPRR